MRGEFKLFREIALPRVHEGASAVRFEGASSVFGASGMSRVLLARFGAEPSTVGVRRAQIHEHLQEMGLVIPILQSSS